jgi:Multiubiquitin
MSHEHENQGNSATRDVTAKTTIRIFVEVTKTDQREVEFHQDQVTGREIKEAAKVPLDTDLAVRREGKLALVTNDETITIKNGLHFVVLPPGTIS